MYTTISSFISGLIALVYAESSFAHPGHLGDIAGHSHVIALGAALAAGLVGGLVIKYGKSSKRRKKEPINGELKTASKSNS